MAKRELLAGVAGLCGLLASGAAQASLIGVQWDGSAPLPPGPYFLGASNSGYLSTYSGPGTSAAFVVTGIQSGPFGLSSNIIVNTAAFFGVPTITVWVTEIGLLFPSGYNWEAQTGLTVNFVPPNTSVTVSSYIDPTDTPFAETVLTDTLTCAPSGPCDNAPGSVTALAGSGPFSITQKYVITVSGDTLPDPFNLSTIVTNLSTAAVPEASTWTMMLVGFAGLGYGAMRSRKTSPATA